MTNIFILHLHYKNNFNSSLQILRQTPEVTFFSYSGNKIGHLKKRESTKGGHYSSTTFIFLNKQTKKIQGLVFSFHWTMTIMIFFFSITEASRRQSQTQDK